jgi:hypothetical protein
MSRRTALQRAIRIVFQTLTDIPTIAWSHSSGESAVVTLGGNRTLAAATGQVAGNISVLRVVQDGTGSRTLTWNSTYKFHADGPPVLSTAAAAEDTFVFVSDGTNLHCINQQKRGTAPRGYIDGLTMSNDTDTAHDISVSAGEATLIESTTGETRVLGVNSAAFVKQIDVDWAEGSAAGGFASALTLSTSTWYHYFMIAKTDGQVDFGYDTSTSAANLLTDASAYSFYRRIGSVLTDGSSNIIQFTQFGDTFLWTTPIHDISTADIGTSVQTVAISVPTGYRTQAIVMIDLDATTVESWAYVKSPDQADEAPVDSLPSSIRGAGVSSNSGVMSVLTDASAQITYRGATSTDDFELETIGWIDPRGRDI